MRWSPILLLVLLAGCDWPAAGDTTGSGGGTTDGGSSCAAENASSCSDCESCDLKGPCESLWATCMASPDCLSIDGCAGGCNGDATCLQGCYAQNPNGQAAYQAAESCVYCQQCTCSGLCSSI